MNQASVDIVAQDVARELFKVARDISSLGERTGSGNFFYGPVNGMRTQIRYQTNGKGDSVTIIRRGELLVSTPSDGRENYQAILVAKPQSYDNDMDAYLKRVLGELNSDDAINKRLAELNAVV